MRRPALFVFVLALASCARSPKPSLQPYEMDWRDNEGSLVDVSFLLDAPAGKDGFVTVKDGRLAMPAGRRFRIWGMNTSFAASLPDKESAPADAAHLARFGINCIRVHHGDRRAPRGILAAGREDTRALDPERMDRLDFFIAELKKRGIYTDLNLNVSRPFTEADGVKDAELIGYGKALTYFDPRLIELQKEYARLLLTHRNPYTGSEYRDEPAIAIVELVNENSIVESWVRGRLLGRQTEPPPRATWTDIPPSYEKDLTARYNAWLRQKLSPADLARLRKEAGVARDVPRLKPDEFAAASDFRFGTEASFYVHLEDNYFLMMADYLRKELKVKSLLLGTSAHSKTLSPYPLLSSTAKLDIVDGHTYWQHPAYRTDPETGESYSEYENTPMVNEPLDSTVAALARNAVAGKPYTVSEVNHPYPAEHACEGVPILAAYGAFHDWDGIFWYTFSHDEPANWKPDAPGTFDFRLDPVKMTQLAAGALMFLRPDISPARTVIERSYTREQVIEGLRLSRSEAPFFTPGFPIRLALQHGTRIASFDGPPGAAKYPGHDENPIASDTGELAWYSPEREDGVVTVNSPRSQALIGFVKANPKTTDNLAAAIENDFAAITLCSLDGEPVSGASRLLLSTGAKVANQGLVWNATRTRVTATGGPPVLIETVTGVITLRNLEGASSVDAAPLNSGGKPAGETVRAVRSSDGWRLTVGATPTPWYLVRVTR